MPILDAVRDLIEALEDGRVQATGLRNGHGDRGAIPASDWADLRFDEMPLRAVPKDHSRAGATHWHDVRFRRSEILATWPETRRSDTSGPSEAAPKAITKKLPPRKDLDAFYRERAKGIARGDRAPSERADYAALEERFGADVVTRPQVRELRAKHYPAGSMVRGRPRKNRR